MSPDSSAFDQPVVRPAVVGDLGAVAFCHRRAFPKSALTRLGVEALRRYYAWQLEGPHDLLAEVVFQRGELVAFCFSGSFRGALAGFLEKNRRFLVGAVLLRPWLVANPLFRRRLLSGLATLRALFRYRKTVRPEPDSAEHEGRVQASPHYGILSIAVDPSLQGSGLGKLLMARAEAEARRRDFDEMWLTVAPDNAQALRFYERLGWQRTSAGGAWQGAMRLDLTTGQDFDS